MLNEVERNQNGRKDQGEESMSWPEIKYVPQLSVGHCQCHTYFVGFLALFSSLYIAYGWSRDFMKEMYSLLLGKNPLYKLTHYIFAPWLRKNSFNSLLKKWCGISCNNSPWFIYLLKHTVVSFCFGEITTGNFQITFLIFVTSHYEIWTIR